MGGEYLECAHGRGIFHERQGHLQVEKSQILVVWLTRVREKISILILYLSRRIVLSCIFKIKILYLIPRLNRSIMQ